MFKMQIIAFVFASAFIALLTLVSNPWKLIWYNSNQILFFINKILSYNRTNVVYWSTAQRSFFNFEIVCRVKKYSPTDDKSLNSSGLQYITVTCQMYYSVLNSKQYLSVTFQTHLIKYQLYRQSQIKCVGCFSRF